MKTLILSALLLGGSAFAAQAESFTFTSKSTTTNSIIAPLPDTKPVVAGWLTTSGQTVYASGKTEASTGDCDQWTTPPGSTFQGNGVCALTTSAGDKYTIVFGCDFANKEMTEGACWGGLNGISGAHAKKLGVLSWTFKTNADGKTGGATGTGQWGD